MTNKSRKLVRKTGFIEQTPVIFIATEGNKTEPQYFDLFKNKNKDRRIKILPSKGKSSPNGVLKRLKKEIKEIGAHDKAWLVIDVDEWTPAQLESVYRWSITKTNYGLAVSNPKFEYWLLLHFEMGNNIAHKDECTERLLRHLPTFEKGDIDSNKFTPARINNAIKIAKNKDVPRCTKWPEEVGSTVYRLVQILVK